MKETNIKRIEGARLLPRDSLDYFKDNPDIWDKLKNGEVVSVPTDLCDKLKGIEVVKSKQKKKEFEINEGGEE